jgi:hypothetical protein
MAFTDQEVVDAQTSAAATAKKGIKALTIGDKQVTFATVREQIDASRLIQADIDGGVYDTVPAKKGYF